MAVIQKDIPFGARANYGRLTYLKGFQVRRHLVIRFFVIYVMFLFLVLFNIRRIFGSYLTHKERKRTLRTWRLWTAVEIWSGSSICVSTLSTGAMIRVPGLEW